MSSCKICNFSSSDKFESQNQKNKEYKIDCPNCGTYYMSKSCYEDYPTQHSLLKENGHILSGYLRNRIEKEGDSIHLTSKMLSQFEDILSDPDIPKTADDKIIKALQYIYNKSDRIGGEVFINYNRNRAIGYAIDENELKEMLNILEKERGFIRSRAKIRVSGSYILTDIGRKACDDYLKSKRETSKSEESVSPASPHTINIGEIKGNGSSIYVGDIRGSDIKSKYQNNKEESFFKKHLTQLIIGIIGAVISGIILYMIFGKY